MMLENEKYDHSRISHNVTEVVGMLLDDTGIDLSKYRSTSWYIRKASDLVTFDWHVDFDEGEKSVKHLVMAYPHQTEFAMEYSLDESSNFRKHRYPGKNLTVHKIYIPKIGELVETDLCRVWHRTPKIATGKPRLLIRIEKIV